MELGRVSKFIRGITFKPEDPISPSEPDAVVCMRTKNIQADLEESDLLAVPSRFVRRGEQYLREGDLLLSSANSWNLVGKCVYVHDLGYQATAGGFISIVRPLQECVHPRYFYWWMASGETQHKIRHCGRQTTNISNLGVERFQRLRIPLPPLPEQKRIAAILDKADEIRRKRERAIEMLDQLQRSVFLAMFGDPVTNPKGWEVRRLGEVVAFVSGGTPSKRRPEYWEGETPWVSAKDMKQPYLADALDHLSERAFEETSARRLSPGDLLVVVRGMILAHTVPIAMATTDLAFNQDLKGLKILKGAADPEFLLWQLRQCEKFILSRTSEAAHGTKRLELRELEGLPVILPALATQRRFAAVVKRIQTLKHKSAEARQGEFSASLSQRAFRGEL